MRTLALTLLVSGTMFGQAMTDFAAVTAGGTVGGASGKAVSNGISSIFGKVSDTTGTAAGATTKPAAAPAPASAPAVAGASYDLPPASAPVARRTTTQRQAALAAGFEGTPESAEAAAQPVAEVTPQP